MPASPDQTSPWTDVRDYIVRLHADERSQRDRLDKRADTLVTSSGVLVTLVAAATALIPKPKGLEVPNAVVVLLLIGLAMFLVTILLSQLVWIHPHGEFGPSKGLGGIERISDTNPPDMVQLARSEFAISADMRRSNDRRWRQLTWAGVAQMCWRPRCLNMIRHRSACTLWHVLMMTASLAGW